MTCGHVAVRHQHVVLFMPQTSPRPKNWSWRQCHVRESGCASLQSPWRGICARPSAANTSRFLRARCWCQGVIKGVEIFTRGVVLQSLRHRLCRKHGRGTPVMVAFLFQVRVNTCMCMCMLCLCLCIVRLLHMRASRVRKYFP
jgi:hypothetical protein